jgi:hypothetical protein
VHGAPIGGGGGGADGGWEHEGESSDADSLSLDLSAASEELACVAVEEGVEELWAEGGSSGHPHPPVRVGY